VRAIQGAAQSLSDPIDIDLRAGGGDLHGVIEHIGRET